MVGGSVLALLVAVVVGGWMLSSKGGAGRDTAAAGNPEGSEIVRETTKPADTGAPAVVPGAGPAVSGALPPARPEGEVDAAAAPAVASGDTPAPAVTSGDTPKPATIAVRHESSPRPSAHPPPAKSAAVRSARPNCNPNYTLDADGNKIFKPECFAH
jgi:hypothetical protein